MNFTKALLVIAAITAAVMGADRYINRKCCVVSNEW